MGGVDQLGTTETASSARGVGGLLARRGVGVGGSVCGVWGAWWGVWELLLDVELVVEGHLLVEVQRVGNKDGDENETR